MKRYSRGFTLIEVLVSLALSGIILLAAMSLLLKTASIDGDSVKASQQIDLVMTLNGIRDKLTNVPKLYPPQALYEPNDKKFIGVTDVHGDNDLKRFCHEGHALIYTITDTTKDPAKIIRFWKEENLKTGVNKTFVINFDPGTTTSKSFPAYNEEADDPPKELIAIDADGKIKRSYIIQKVQYYTTPQTSDLITQEPYSLPHVAITVKLANTLRESQTVIPDSSVSFVTESLLYPSVSYYICLQKETLDLIEAPLYAPTKQNILISSNYGKKMSLKTFKTEFIGTREDKRINLNDFYTDLSNAPSVASAVKTKSSSSEYEVQVSRECMNIIRLTLIAEFKANDSSAKIEQVINRKTVFINNLMPERPFKCQNGT